VKKSKKTTKMSVISFVLLVQLLAFATSHPTQSNLKPSSQQTDDFEHPAMRLTTHREKRELPNLHFDPPAAEIDPEFWNRQAINTLKRQLNKKQLHGKAKNVIFFLGDGMGLATQMATRMLKGGEEKELAFEKFPFSGLSKTYCANTQVADSACSATAYLSGVKANYGTLGLTANVLQDDCAGQNRTENHVESIIKLAQDAGMKTGIVTNTRITHATPAATYAYSANRNWENDKRVTEDGGNPQVCSDIAWQMINGKVGKRMNVILGGGRQEFLLESERDVDGHHGKRSDKNLIKLWYHIQRNKNHRYIETKEELFDVDDDVERLLGLFASNHLPYHLDDKAGEKPTLAEMVSKALDVLQTDSDDNGFMLFVEGGKIDHGHHFGLAHKALDETLEFEKAIELAQSRVDEDETLIVVSSDHSHAFTVAGYSVSDC